MWQLNTPKPVKLIIGILASDDNACKQAVDAVKERFGKIDLLSQVWPFNHTDYYIDELGPEPVRQFVTFDSLIAPDQIAQIKHITNDMEKALADEIDSELSRPVNLDPGYIETSKLILATTKNFSHRIYIGHNMWAEVTLMYSKGKWKSFEFTFPDYRETRYHNFLNKVREKLYLQLKDIDSCSFLTLNQTEDI